MASTDSRSVIHTNSRDATIAEYGRHQHQGRRQEQVSVLVVTTDPSEVLEQSSEDSDSKDTNSIGILTATVSLGYSRTAAQH
jgi:hypothetical protein